MGDIKQSFFSNLLLLDFNVKEMETSYLITFNKDMFDTINKTGFEVVSHFLFSKITHFDINEFKCCFPVYDAQSGRTFRKITYQWLTKIMDDEDSHLPRFPPSLLISPGGKLFIRVYLALSQYVLLKLIKDCKVRHEDDILSLSDLSTEDDSMKKKSIESFVIATSVSVNSFVHQVRNQDLEHKQWNNFVKKLQAVYWGLDIVVKELDARCKADLELYTKSLPPDESLHTLESLLRKSKLKIKQLYSSWENIKNFNLLTENGRRTLQHFIQPDSVEDSVENFKLLSPGKSNLSKTTPIESEVLFNDGKVVLISLSKVVVKFLKEMDVFFNSVKNPEVNSVTDDLNTVLSNHKKKLNSLMEMRNELEEMIPNLTESVSDLRSADGPFNYEEKVKILPLTPVLSFSPTKQHLSGTTPIVGNFVKSSKILCTDTPPVRESSQSLPPNQFKEKLSSKIPIICQMKSATAQEENVKDNNLMLTFQSQDVHQGTPSHGDMAKALDMPLSPHTTEFTPSKGSPKFSTDNNTAEPYPRRSLKSQRLEAVKSSLAERIVESAVNGNLTPAPIISLIEDEFRSEFDESVFASKDVIPRTPQDTVKGQPNPEPVSMSNSFQKDMSIGSNMNHSNQADDVLPPFNTPKNNLLSKLIDIKTPLNQIQTNEVHVPKQFNLDFSPLVYQDCMNANLSTGKRETSFGSDLPKGGQNKYGWIDDLNTSKCLLDESCLQLDISSPDCSMPDKKPAEHNGPTIASIQGQTVLNRPFKKVDQNDDELNSLIARYSKISSQKDVGTCTVYNSNVNPSPKVGFESELLKPVKVFKLDTTMFE